MSQKRVRKVNKYDGTLEEMHEDEVLFERTDEDPIMVTTTSITLTQATSHNILAFNEKVMEAELENQNLKDELISLRDEIMKRKKVDYHLVPLKENILNNKNNCMMFK